MAESKLEQAGKLLAFNVKEWWNKVGAELHADDAWRRAGHSKPPENGAEHEEYQKIYLQVKNDPPYFVMNALEIDRCLKIVAEWTKGK